jgi:hypothetical protein
MQRRTFLIQGAALVGGLVVGSAQAATPRTVCGIDKKLHVQVCRVAVSRPIVPVQAGSNSSAGSWLACLQMVFKSYGHAVPLQSLIRDVYQGSVPKEPWKDLSPLSRPISNDKGHGFAAITETLHVSAVEAAGLLAEDQPLIIGAFGHPVLLTAIRYSGDPLGPMTIRDAEVIDPQRPHVRRTVSSPEWVNVTFIHRVAVKK